MSKILAVMILFNVLMGVAFVYSNYHIWNNLNARPYTTPYWGPFAISYVARDLYHGELIYDGIFFLDNYPFLLFWVAMIGNILFAVLILRSKERLP